MNLNLTKPLVFIDIEATGLNILADRIVELSLIKLEVNYSTTTKTYLINPEMQIPEEVIKIHGITNEKISNAPTFKMIAQEISNFFSNADIAGYNSNRFDIPMLMEEFLRAEVDFDLDTRQLLDVQNIFHFMEPRTLRAAYKFYCKKNLENAHSAEQDALTTLEVFKSQLERYADTKIEDEKGNLYSPDISSVAALTKLSTQKQKPADLVGRIVWNENGEEIFNFGKFKNQSVREVFRKEQGYFGWMMKGDFSLYTKKIITKIKLSMI